MKRPAAPKTPIALQINLRQNTTIGFVMPSVVYLKAKHLSMGPRRSSATGLRGASNFVHR
jgi:hypothetical protein